MSKSVLYMSMSVDGFIASPNNGPDNPGGDGFGRLHDWLDTKGQATEQMMEEMNATGAVLADRRTVEQVDHYEGHHGVPIFVVNHRPPSLSVANFPLVTYVTDGIEAAMTQAKAAAGDRNVLVHGAYTARRALEAGVLDELQIASTRGDTLRLAQAAKSSRPLDIDGRNQALRKPRDRASGTVADSLKAASTRSIPGRKRRSRSDHSRRRLLAGSCAEARARVGRPPPR